MPQRDVYDVTIIGGGPTGLFSAFYAGMRELKTKIIETLPVLGGQVEIMYPEKNIFDVGAFPYIKGADLIDQLIKQLEPFQPTICLEESVLEIHKNEDDLFEMKTTEGTHYTRAILVTTGQGSFEPRKLTFPYPIQYEDNNLHYFVKDLETYRNKVVAIAGGGDSAVDWALTLKPVAKKVVLVHRRDKFRAHEASVSYLRNSSIDILTPYIPVELIGDKDRLEKIRLQKRRQDEHLTLPVDYFIVNFGFVSKNKQLSDWGLENVHNRIVVNQKMETNIPGIFAAGDVTTFDGKVKLIATGFGEAPTAINRLIQYLNPGQFIQAPTQSAQYGADKFKKQIK